MNDQSTPIDEAPATGIPRPVIPYHNEAIDKLADSLIHEVEDLPEVISRLHGVMTPIDFEHLCQKIEICEIHFCDYRICQDDLDDCPSGAEAKVRNT